MARVSFFVIPVTWSVTKLSSTTTATTFFRSRKEKRCVWGGGGGGGHGILIYRASEQGPRPGESLTQSQGGMGLSPASVRQG